MSDRLVASLVILCQIARSKIIKVKERRLSEAERELLIVAAQQGTFYLVDQIRGTWVRAGGKDFWDTNDPAFAAKYLEAFRELCDHGYVAHDGGRSFMLTGSGFEKAREEKD